MKKSSTTIILTKTNTIKRIYFIMVFVSAYPYVRERERGARGTYNKMDENIIARIEVLFS
jgi:hypothetical protein